MSDDYLTRPLSRVEQKLLTPEEKKARRLAQNRIKSKKYRESYPEKIVEYTMSPAGKKSALIAGWVRLGLQETEEDLDRIYHLWLTQELCNACDCGLTRDGIKCSTQATMDHCHISHRFRHIICHNCNSQDNWKKFFC